MLSKPQTVTKMQELLTHAQDILRADSDEDFFKPQDAGKILNGIDVQNPVLRSLLFAEAEVIKHSFEGGLKIASSQTVAPSAAVKALATFGSKLTEAFNNDITKLLGPGIQALGTRVFLDASRAIDESGAQEMAETNAMLNLEFLKPTSKFDDAALLSAGRVDTDQLAFADRVLELQLVQAN